MKLFGFLRKPDWEHKEAAVRLQAVQASHDPALLERLEELAQRDPDAQVRCAAMRRVDDPVVLARRMRGDVDPRVAAVARERLIVRLCAGDLPLEQRRAVMLDLPDPEVLQQVAVQSPDVELRRAALEYIDRPGFLAERCLNDPDPELRLALLQRIDAPETLQRIAGAARKRDKVLSRVARERMEALQLASGDAVALERRALSLCERAGRLGRELPPDRERQLEALREDWAGIAGAVGADLQRRTAGALEMAAAAISASRGAVVRSGAGDAESGAGASNQEVDRGGSVGDGAESQGRDGEEGPDGGARRHSSADLRREGGAVAGPEGTSGPSDADAMAGGSARGDGAAREAAKREAAAAEVERDAAAAEAEREAAAARAAERKAAQARAAEQARQALAALQQALDDSNLGEARSARGRIRPKTLPAEARRRLAEADERLRKLEQWQRWSGHEVRRRLCDEVEALHGSGLHPDALATRLKELQAEWSRLDALEGDAAPAHESGIARRFRALCHRAIRPARGYFEKRRQVRGERAEQVEVLLAEAAAALEAGAGAAALAPMRRRITSALRELDTVAPEKRGEQGRALRAMLGRMADAAAAGRESAALDKRRLLARLRRDLGSADAAAGIALAKEAQAQWTRLARADRDSEETLRKELGELIDPLFEGARERDAQRRQQESEADAAAQSVLQELDALAAADATRLAHAEAHLEALAARWRALQPVPDAAAQRDARGGRGARGGRDGRAGRDARGDGRGQRERRPAARAHPLESRYGAAVARVEAARARAGAARESAAMDALCRAGVLLDRLRADGGSGEGEALRSEFAALELPGDARAPLEQRLAGIDAGSEPMLQLQDAEALAVRAELIAGLDSPPEAAALRRQEQLQRLAARLEGAEHRAPPVQVRELLVTLAAHGGLDAERRRVLQERVLGAWRQLSGA